MAPPSQKANRRRQARRLDGVRETSREQIRAADPKLEALKDELSWTRFVFLLEQRLGDLLETGLIQQHFGDLLKERLSYDYLEVARLGAEAGNDNDPTNWVRNDTGYGDKLLTILLSAEFLRGLRWRRNPLPLNSHNLAQIVENPELLRIMNLQSGLLVPLGSQQSAQGVIKIFFQRDVNLDLEQQRWLKICGAILSRSLMRAVLYQKAQKLATIDGLTGLYNHRYFMDQLHKEFARARRYRNWLSLIIIDIDYFKQYNDANGHLAGDRILRRIAQTLKSGVREMDLVARYGGEEFALLLPEISGENGMIVAEKIRREVEVQRFKNERRQPQGRLTVSLGVAQNSPHLKNHREMFNLADAALYQAKLAGRNRCVFTK